MKCDECGGRYVACAGVLEMNDKYIGRFIVVRLDYMKCDGCGDLLFSPKAAQLIEAAREAALRKILQARPLSDFVSASDAAALLGITRQALHKHKRIRRGFIFQTEFEGKIVYLRESVVKFMKKGDGRFPLCEIVRPVRYAPEVVTETPVSWTALNLGLLGPSWIHALRELPCIDAIALGSPYSPYAEETYSHA